MTTVRAFVRSTSKKAGKIAVRLRLTDGRERQLFYKTKLEVLPEDWDARAEGLKSRKIFDVRMRREFEAALTDYKTAFEDIYEENRGLVEFTPEVVADLMEKRLHPEANDVEEVVEDHTNLSFFEQFERFLIYKGYPYSHRKDYDVLARLLKRFERFRQIETGKDFKLELSALTSDTLVKIRDFVLHENLLMESKRFAVIYVEMPEDKKIGQRGYNTMVRYMKRMRTFIKWCLDDGLLMKDPFGKFTIGNPREGKPFYINMEERDVIAKTDMAARWAALTPEQRKEICQNPTPHALERLTIQRDIFIFQCMIGCRVGDLMKFTYANLNNGVLTYVPHKTKDNISSSRVSIPLNQTAMEIVLRYESHPLRKGRLLPFLCTSKYNLDIKSIFKLCGIDRIVPVLNALTSEYEMKPLYEVASSHMARRTFIGNLYKKVKDPELIGKLSGHVEGSKAFNRYRDIDMDIKQDLVKLLEE